jgi:2-phospho-L-lactate guanylyltransferase
MTYRALIPVKMLSEAKSRLTPYLTAGQRATLVLHMLHHVIEMLRASDSLESVSVVSPDLHVLEQARRWGADVLIEEEQGHNPALDAAAKKLAKGATALLTISADLPLLQAHDIRNMIELSRHYNVVLASSGDGTGTNALLAQPPLAIPYAFGPNSLQRYTAEAQQWDLTSTLYRSTSTALDIDTIEDLELFDNKKREIQKGSRLPDEVCGPASRHSLPIF